MNEITQIHEEIKRSKDPLPTIHCTQEFTRTPQSKTQMSQNTKELITEITDNNDLDGEALTPQQCSERNSHTGSNKVLKSRINQGGIINSQEINIKYHEDGEEISGNNT